MTAMRVLIAWLYSNTKSVLLAQLMHACYTGSLVIFSPPGVTAAQEVFWYALYAAALWLAVAIVTLTFGAITNRPFFLSLRPGRSVREFPLFSIPLSFTFLISSF
jgi:hypothetical protein